MRALPTDQFPKPHHAFGVDPARRNFYSLRQSRYDALAQDISDWAGIAARSGRKLTLLDVGSGTGVLLRHLEFKRDFDKLTISAADRAVSDHVYRRELYQQFFVGDLMGGYPQIPSDSYDVVICEQLLEHLPNVDVAIATLERVLRPGGKLIVGVPIFLPPLHALRKHVIPIMDKVFLPRKSRGHVQAFSLASFLGQMKRHSNLRLLRVRGFRVISGGLLAPLENYRWWWRLNRRIGELMPALCIEIQAIMQKPLETSSETGRRAAVFALPET